MRLTTKSIQTIEPIPPRTDRIEFDDAVPGFGVRARTGGSKVYVVQYAIGEKTRRMTLGKVELQAVDKARDKAKDILAAVRMGRDPAGEKQLNRSTATETFKAVALTYLAFQKEHGGPESKGIRPRYYDEVERHLITHPQTKKLHGLLLGKIQQRDISNAIGAIRTHHPITANRVRTSLASFFSWALSEGLVAGNPVIGTTRTKEDPRKRVLDPTELRLIWTSLKNDHYGAIMKLLMLTGQRADEIASLRWSEISETTVKDKRVSETSKLPSFNIDVIDLPAERTKNRRPHIVPLSKPAKTIISAQRRDRTNSDGSRRELIFGLGTRGFSGWGKSKEILDRCIAEQIGRPLSHWTPHDLRRSMSTIMNDELDVLPHVVEAILNHTSTLASGKSGVGGIYNRAIYLRERAEALVLWAEYLMSVIEDRERESKRR